MSYPIGPLFAAGVIVGLIAGVVIGGLVGVFVWPNPPCPTCPIALPCPTCPTPLPCPTCDACPTPPPRPELDEGPGARGEPFPHFKETGESVESAFYRGAASACVNIIGFVLEVDRETTARSCKMFIDTAYGADWFHESPSDGWIWPPVLEPTPSPKSDAAP